MIYITFIVFFDNQAKNANSSHTWHELNIILQGKTSFQIYPSLCLYLLISINV